MDLHNTCSHFLTDVRLRYIKMLHRQTLPKRALPSSPGQHLTQQTTRRNGTEGGRLHIRHLENLRSRLCYMLSVTKSRCVCSSSYYVIAGTDSLLQSAFYNHYALSGTESRCCCSRCVPVTRCPELSHALAVHVVFPLHAVRN
jgi:hypothetical protein